MHLWKVELRSLAGQHTADLRIVAEHVDEALAAAYATTYEDRNSTVPLKNWNEWHVLEVKRLCKIDAVPK